MDAEEIYESGTHDGVAEAAGKKPLNGWLALLVAAVAMWLGMTLSQVVSWTDRVDGFLTGAITGLILAPMITGIYLLPWTAGVWALYRWRKWRRFRTLWMLAPALLLSLQMVVGSAWDSTSPRRTFHRIMKVEMPADARGVKWHLSGGLFADHTDVFFFQTTPAEVDRLIAGMGLEKESWWTPERGNDPPPRGVTWWPDFRKWDGARQYRRNEEDYGGGWKLYTDEGKTRVVVVRLTI